MNSTISVHSSFDEGVKRYPLKYRPAFSKLFLIQGKSEYVEGPVLHFFKQELYCFAVHVQVIEALAEREVEIFLELSEPSVFSLFVLEGDLILRGLEGRSELQPVNNSYFFAYSQASRHSVGLSKGSHRLMIMNFHPDLLSFYSQYLKQLSALYLNFKARTNRPVLLPLCRISTQIDYCLDKIRNSPFLSPVETSAGIQGPLARIANIYNASLTSHENTGLFDNNEKVLMLQKFIEETYASFNSISCALVAKRIGVPEWRVKEMSKAAFGKTIHQKVIELKMKKALVLLKEGNKVKSVAEAVGYEDHFYFSRAFKRYYGSSPARFNYANSLTFRPVR